MDTERPPPVARFEEALDTSFSVSADDGDRVAMTLLEVARSDHGPGWESFSLLFAGPTPALPQAIYAVDHPELGAFELFLVPIASPAEVQQYEAVFNRSAS